MPAGVNGGPATARPFSAQHVPCLRDCRFYFSATSHFDHGNPSGSFAEGYEPTQRHHMCMRAPGVYLELSADSPVYTCNQWDPIDPKDVVARTRRRERYLALHPADEEDDSDDAIDDGDAPS
jgi:hypothetical protein